MIDKFKTIRDYKITNDNIFLLSSPQIDCCVVYCVWSNPLYLKFLKLSLISQFKYTDIHKTKRIVVFVDEKCHKEAQKELQNFPVCITKTNRFSKYTILSHPELSKDNKIALFDCDTFFCGKRSNLYENIMLCNNDDIFMMKDRDITTINTFYVRKCLTNFNEKSDELYLNAVASGLKTKPKGLLKLMKRNQWFLSCCFITNRHNFSSKEWLEYSKYSFEELTSYCDETVFLTYGWKNKYNFKHANEIKDLRIVYSHELDQLGSTANSLLLAHPLHGSYCSNMNVQKLYDTIQS